MLSLISGVVVFIVTAATFWSLLPRGGKLHRWADTEWEPYVSVAICSGVAFGFCHHGDDVVGTELPLPHRGLDARGVLNVLHRNLAHYEWHALLLADVERSTLTRTTA